MNRGALLLALLLLPAATCAQQAAGHTRTIRTTTYIDADGKLADGAVVLLNGKSIAQVGGDVPADVPLDSYPGAVLSPGLIDCQAMLGTSSALSERQNALQPQINARDAFNRFSPQLQAALAAGVTTFALTPDDQNLIGGRIAICQTAGPEGQPRILTDAGPLRLSLAPEAFKVDREPTSRIGALGMLREAIEGARGSQPVDETFAAFATGKQTGFLTAPSGADALAGLALAEAFGLKLVLCHTTDARRVTAQISGSSAPPAQLAGIIVGPFDLTTGPRDTAAAGLFARRGLPVAIAGGLPGTSADSLRIGAALAARAGLSSEAARRAITAVPAELLGVGDRIGAIRPGQQADIVVFSGDPLDLRARVLAVYVAGRRVYSADTAVPQGVYE